MNLLTTKRWKATTYRNDIRIGTTKTAQYIDPVACPNTEYKYTGHLT